MQKKRACIDATPLDVHVVAWTTRAVGVRLSSMEEKWEKDCGVVEGRNTNTFSLSDSPRVLAAKGVSFVRVFALLHVLRLHSEQRSASTGLFLRVSVSINLKSGGADSQVPFAVDSPPT